MASAALALLDQFAIGGTIPAAQKPVQNPNQNVDLVRRVQRGDADGMAELYEYISTGLRPYLARQLRSQDFHDKVHSIFVDVVIAIQRGQLREPHRLMGFARTIARRKVSGYIDDAASSRRNQVDIGTAFWLASPRATPESEMISREQQDLVRRALAHLTEREGEILKRFYMQEQSQQQICQEMGLTHTQYRLLKWRSKARFELVSRRQIASHNLRSLRGQTPDYASPVMFPSASTSMSNPR
jgi:RNA polymerase sigma factor (sigma-70 family)